MEWETEIPVELALSYGVASAHCVFFRPLSDEGRRRTTVMCMIPETPMAEVAGMMKVATDLGARVCIVCDTADQAKAIAEYATKNLPYHTRLSLPDAITGRWTDTGNH